MFEMIIEECKSRLVIAQNVEAIQEILIETYDRINKHTAEEHPDKLDIIVSLCKDQNSAFNMVMETTTDLSAQKVICYWFMISLIYQVKKLYR